MIKKVISIVLTLTIVMSLFSIIPIHGSAATEDESVGASGGRIGDCWWSFDDNGTLTIGGNGSMYEYYWKGWGKTIKESATAVIIEEGVTDIREWAFSEFRNLTEITIPKSVKQIGEDAFKECMKLKDVYISDLDAWCRINYLEGYSSPLAFADNFYCNNVLVTNIVIPSGITKLDRSMFSCASLISVTIPNSVVDIADGAFHHCTSLKSIIIPDSVKNLGKWVFSGCTNLTTISLSSHIDSVGKGLFRECNKLENVSIPDSVTSIGEEAFYNCYSLQNIIIPNKITTIGDRAFSQCNNLEYVSIGNSVNSIGASAFSNCKKLSTVAIPNNVVSVGAGVFSGCENLSSVSLSNRITSISDSTFGGCRSLSSIAIPDGVNAIGRWAFLGCSSLSSLDIPDNVTNIGKEAFNSCKKLNKITIPDSVETIGDGLFWNCDNLSTIRIGSGLKNLGNYVFQYCPNLLSIIVSPANNNFSSIDGNLYNKGQNKLIAYATGKTEDTFTIPDSVQIIDGAFFGCNSLTHMTIPDNVTSFQSAFGWCKNLENVTVGNGATSISKEAFNGCIHLKSISIPKKISTIKMSAFWDCNNLRDVYFNGPYDDWTGINIESGNEPLSSANIHCTDTLEGSLYCNSSKVTGINLLFNPKWFKTDSSVYNHNIARMCSLVDLAGYQSVSDLTNTLESLEFNVDNDFLNLNTGRDEVNFFIASKNIILNDKTFKLIFIGCIGSHDYQWESDFDPNGIDSKTNCNYSEPLPNS